MVLDFVAFGDLSRGCGFVKGHRAGGAAAGDWRLATGDCYRAEHAREPLLQEIARPVDFVAVAGRQPPRKRKTARLSLAVFRFLLSNSQHSDKRRSRSVSFVIERDPVGFAEALQHGVDLQGAGQ